MVADVLQDQVAAGGRWSQPCVVQRARAGCCGKCSPWLALLQRSDPLRLGAGSVLGAAAVQTQC